MMGERVVLEASDAGETRRVSILAGESLQVIEQSCGPVTEAAYGSARHGHKLVCERAACARVLGAAEDADAEVAAAAFFGRPPAEEAPLLSDLMDLFDQVGERYAYMAWTARGDGAFRPAAAAIGAQA